MTETRKKVRPAADKAPAKKRPAVKKSPAKKSERDDFDDFLEAAEKSEREAKKKSSSGYQAKHAASPEKVSGQKKSAARKKPENASARPAKDASQPQKTVAKKKTSAKYAAKTDAYDEFLKEAERPAKPKKKSKKKKQKQAMGAMLTLLILIGCVLGLAGWQYTQYQTFLTMKTAVDRATFYEGTYVEGVDVSQMTLQQAMEHWQTAVEPSYSQRTVTLSNGAKFTAEELGYSSDYALVLANAWNAGRGGSLVERYEALSQRRAQTANYNVTRTPYTQEAVQNCVSAIAQQIDKPAQNAKIASFDVNTNEFVFDDEVIGSKLNVERLAADMADAIGNGGGEVELIVNSIQPEVVKADIAGLYGMITSAVTDASSSYSNRLSNIKLAIDLINGTCLKPGETFSFNEVVGERTSERGFKSAAAYSSGSVINEVGGGICQVSTTLFNAAVKADMEIVERSSHSMTVSYVDRGKDAAVDWGNKDLKFKNTSDDNVYIICYLDNTKRVRIGIFGKLLPNGEYITVEGKTTERIDFETELVPNTNLASGVTQVVQKGKKGYKAVAYKIRWDKNDKQISKEELCRSSYRVTNEIIEFGP